MTSRLATLVRVVIVGTLLLTSCLGEPMLPPLEAVQAPTHAPPPVDPTVAAAPRLSLSLVDQPITSDQPIPQIRHDLIGRSDCLMCHKQGVSDAPRIPDAHRGLESNTCQTCHTAPASADLGGEELYIRLCARCHGDDGEGILGPALNIKTFLNKVTDEELKEVVVRGRGASEMLAWGDLGLVSDQQIEELVAMIRAWEPSAPETAMATSVKPVSASQGEASDGETLYSLYCSSCHGLNGETATEDGFILRERVGSFDDATLARQIRGGSESMPPFHSLLTTENINDLLALMHTWQAGPQATATPITLSGEDIYARVCTRCHGANGEGGIGPQLNAKEFLTAYDDGAIRLWITRGTLATSMLSWGDLGLLTTEQIDELVVFIRDWEPNAPPTTGEATDRFSVTAELGDAVHGEQLFAQFCSGCHGIAGEIPTSGIILNSDTFLDSLSDMMIASQIQDGGREMPSFHAILAIQDLNDLLAFMRSGFSSLGSAGVGVSFATDVWPIFEDNCAICHGTAGGWSTSSYEEVMNSGENAPVIFPEDSEASLLVQKLRGTQSIGGQMPLSQLLLEEQVDLIVSWITDGALDN